MLPADTGFVTFIVMSDAPRLISALPVKDSDPTLKSLSLENVSALPAVMLPTSHAASEVTLRLLLSTRFSTRFPEAEVALFEIVMPLPVPLALTSTREILVLLLMDSLLPALSIARLFVLSNVPPPESFSV